MGQPVCGFVAVTQLTAARKLYSHEAITAGATARRASLERASEQPE
jgi:hypothetical protein